MGQEQILVIVAIVVVILIAIAIWFTLRKRRTDALRDKFGDEYDRTVEERGNRTRAEDALEEREKRVKELDIRPLTHEEHDRFSSEWHETKTLFVDSPAEAVLRADRTLANMMSTRGFPMGDFDRRYEDLTVDHPKVARHYREGHALTERHNRGEASTEDLRQAIKHYEQLFEELGRDAGTSDAPQGRIAENHDHDHDVTTSRPVSTRDMNPAVETREDGTRIDRDPPRDTVPARPRS